AAQRAGVQTVDLEGLARHRGSVFGGFADDPQPDQKHFETLIFDALRGLDLSRPILIEAESNRIGRCEIPKRLWAAMLGAPRIVLEAAPEIRAPYLISAYGDLVADGGAALEAVERLKPFHAKETMAEWRAMAAAGDWLPLAEALMRGHYDPAYARSRSRGRTGKPIARFRLEALDGATFARVAEDIASALLTPANKELIHGRT
ncbi:MAG: hypothetical protein KAH44_13880, partial [Oricola sp.]|nr:hypothetical protein [Oricola sp.]